MYTFKNQSITHCFIKLNLSIFIHVHCLYRAHGPVWRWVITKFLLRCSPQLTWEQYAAITVWQKGTIAHFIRKSLVPLVDKVFWCFIVSSIKCFVSFDFVPNNTEFYDGAVFCAVSQRRFFWEMFLPYYLFKILCSFHSFKWRLKITYTY